MIDLGNGVFLITRTEWGAKAPLRRQELLPSFGTTTHWEGPHMGLFSHESCFTKVRGIQAFHMGPQRGWSDIAYTALSCPHGFVFQGRWIGVRTAANGTNVGNATAYAVCYLGGEGDPFTDLAKRAQRTALDYLDAHGGAGPNRNCHRDWKLTACPGDVICAWVRAGQPIPGGTPPPPTPTPEDDLPHYHTIRASGRPTLLVTNTGMRASYSGPGAEDRLAADLKALDGIGYDHVNSLRVDPDAYDRLTAPQPLGKANLLLVGDAVGAGFNVTKPATPGRPNPGVFVPDLVAIRDGAG